MRVNEYLRILRDSEIETEGFEIKEIESLNGNTKILRLGSRIKLMIENEIRFLSVYDYFYWNHYKYWENIDIKFVYNKYIIRDILR